MGEAPLSLLGSKARGNRSCAGFDEKLLKCLKVKVRRCAAGAGRARRHDVKAVKVMNWDASGGVVPARGRLCILAHCEKCLVNAGSCE